MFANSALLAWVTAADMGLTDTSLGATFLRRSPCLHVALLERAWCSCQLADHFKWVGDGVSTVSYLRHRALHVCNETCIVCVQSSAERAYLLTA